MAKERIGVMGGTFDPVHAGHIRMARQAMEAAHLDRVLMVPSGTPPHKDEVAPAEDRWRMLCIACAAEPDIIPSRIELDRPGVSYTVDTLSALRETYPHATFFYIIGTDALMTMHRWYGLEQLVRLCSFLVCPRESRFTLAEVTAQQRLLREKGARFHNIPMDVASVASSELRQALAHGEHTPLLPVPVREYCQVKGLYGLTPRWPQAEEWLEKLFQDLSVKRFSHTLAVADTARHLAQVYHLDAEKAELAGLLHDCAKCMPLKEMQQLARDQQLTGDSSLMGSSSLLHAAVGAYVARTAYQVTDAEVLQAIEHHTTGCPGMSQLSMAVYLADKIEPTRESHPTLDMVRVMARLSLEKAMIASMGGTASYVRKSGKSLHPTTLQTLAWLQEQLIKENNDAGSSPCAGTFPDLV